MRKIIISILFSVLSVSIHAQETISLTVDQQTKIIDFICVEITKNAMSCSSLQEDRLSYHDNFEHIGKDNVKNSGFSDFERALNGTAGSRWITTKRRFWNKINDTLRNYGVNRVLAEIVSDTLFKNCKPDKIERDVDEYIKTLKESKKQLIDRPTIKTKQQIIERPVAIKQGFSIFQMILACFISFVGGMIICIIGNLSEKVSPKKHNTKRLDCPTSDGNSNRNKDNSDCGKKNSSSDSNIHNANKNKKSDKSKEQTIPSNQEIKYSKPEDRRVEIQDKEINSKESSSETENDHPTEKKVENIDDIIPEETSDVVKVEEKVVFKYLRKLKDDSFSKISPNIEDDSFFAFNEKTFDLTVVDDNAESALYYADDILTTNVVEIESRVSNPQRIEMLAPGKVEYVGGVWKVIKKVRIKLI